MYDPVAITSLRITGPVPSVNCPVFEAVPSEITLITLLQMYVFEFSSAAVASIILLSASNTFPVGGINFARAPGIKYLKLELVKDPNFFVAAFSMSPT
jgi:hypothetical protein